MTSRILLDERKIQLTIHRLCAQLLEDHGDFSNTVLIGLQPRGISLAKRIHARLSELTQRSIPIGFMDVTFYRDDFRHRSEPLLAHTTDVPFLVEGKRVILIDDVLFTGRSVRAGFDALLHFGRPEKVYLLILIERKYARHFPISPDYLGHSVDTLEHQKVVVKWKESEGQDSVSLILN